MTRMDFGHALALMKQGHKLARAGWNGKGQFVYRVPANSYPAQTDAARATFGEMVPYSAYYALKNAQNMVAPWQPSTGDLDANDWMIVE